MTVHLCLNWDDEPRPNYMVTAGDTGTDGTPAIVCWTDRRTDADTIDAALTLYLPLNGIRWKGDARALARNADDASFLRRCIALATPPTGPRIVDGRRYHFLVAALDAMTDADGVPVVPA